MLLPLAPPLLPPGLFRTGPWARCSSWPARAWRSVVTSEPTPAANARSQKPRSWEEEGEGGGDQSLYVTRMSSEKAWMQKAKQKHGALILKRLVSSF